MRFSKFQLQPAEQYTLYYVGIFVHKCKLRQNSKCDYFDIANEDIDLFIFII